MFKKKRIWFLRTDLVFYFFLLLQIAFWWRSHGIAPTLEVVPNPPSELAVKAISLGDGQFYFRTLAFQLQNLGDTFGRFTALKLYDYSRLALWWKSLDALDSKSHFVPALASYYFAQTQNTPDVRYVVDYLDEHASRDLYHKWWWMGQAVYLANHKLKDKKRALELAYKLASTPRDDIPLWTKQMPAFILEQMGENEAALVIIRNIIENADTLDPGEFNFMRYFVQDRLNKAMEGLTDQPMKAIPPSNDNAHGTSIPDVDPVAQNKNLVDIVKQWFR